MAKITLTRLASLTNQESAVQALNEWAETLEEFSDLVLSRNGETPNTMSANLDMNSNRLINLPAPVDDNDAVRLVDVVDGIQGPTGATGAAGGPLADGDYGDVVVSGTGTVISFDTGVVTAAAKTVLDDATVADMRTTLGLGGAAILNVGTAVSTVAAGNDSRFKQYSISTQNGTYTFATTDAGTVVRHTNATPYAFTIDPVATTNYPVGTQIIVRNAVGGGAITLTRGAGVSLYINGGTTSADATIAAGGVCTLIHEASDVWIAIGPGVA